MTVQFICCSWIDGPFGFLCAFEAQWFIIWVAVQTVFLEMIRTLLFFNFLSCPRHWTFERKYFMKLILRVFWVFDLAAFAHQCVFAVQALKLGSLRVFVRAHLAILSASSSSFFLGQKFMWINLKHLVYLLNLLVTEQIYLLALGTFYNGQRIRIEGSWFMLAFNLFQVEALLDASNFYEVHATLRAEGVGTANINHIDFFS